MPVPVGPSLDPETSSPTNGASTAARVSLNLGRATLGWGILFVMLVAASDFEATAELAAAFATLIFVAVVLLYGPTALANVSSLVATE